MVTLKQTADGRWSASNGEDSVTFVSGSTREHVASFWNQTHSHPSDQITEAMLNAPAPPPVAKSPRKITRGTGMQRYNAAVQFHRTNPQVYPALVKLVRQALAVAGMESSIGFDLAYNRLRWEYEIEIQYTDFKLNNNHLTFYSRRLQMDYPEFYGRWETRKSDFDGIMGWVRPINQKRSRRKVK